jgi:L-amino acid N-acyltransferase YncA
MNISFSRITHEDLPHINRIYTWYILNSTATFHTDPVRDEELLEFLHINHPRYKSYLIFQEDRLAGYCFLTAHKKRQAYDRTAEVTIYLDPEFRHQGIGREALVHLEEVARSVALKNLVGVISGDNAGSIRLFEKAGYEKCAHFKNVGEKFGMVLDVVAYQKELT